MIDLDAFEERAAIMEFCGGMTRFQAETRAAQAQGKRRDEVMNEIRKRDSKRASDQREAVERNGSDNMPRVQRGAKEQA